jgi:hypothetical protein
MIFIVVEAEFKLFTSEPGSLAALVVADTVTDVKVVSPVVASPKGAVYFTVQTIEPPTANGSVGEVQVTVAPAGAVTLQVGLSATIGPLFVQVTVPVLSTPGAITDGKERDTTMSVAKPVVTLAQ